MYRMFVQVVYCCCWCIFVSIIQQIDILNVHHNRAMYSILYIALTLPVPQSKKSKRIKIVK